MNPQQSIPQEIKDFATSVALADKIEKIGTDLGLHIDQIGELDSIVRQALLGILPREQILKQINENLEVEDLAADRILKVVNTEIFMKLRQLIMETHQEREAAIVEETLAHIENPQAAAQTTPVNVAAPTPTAPVVPPAPTPSIPAAVPTISSPHDLTVVPGETAHDVPHIEATVVAPTPTQSQPEPQSAFQGLTAPVNNPIDSEVFQAKKPQDNRGYTSVDPYREPLE